jgi:hypothetical protein
LQSGEKRQAKEPGTAEFIIIAVENRRSIEVTAGNAATI